MIHPRSGGQATWSRYPRSSRGFAPSSGFFSTSQPDTARVHAQESSSAIRSSEKGASKGKRNAKAKKLRRLSISRPSAEETEQPKADEKGYGTEGDTATGHDGSAGADEQQTEAAHAQELLRQHKRALRELSDTGVSEDVAVDFLQELLDDARGALGDDNPVTLSMMNDTANLLESYGRGSAAASLRVVLFKRSKEAHGLADPKTLHALAALTKLHLTSSVAPSAFGGEGESTKFSSDFSGDPPGWELLQQELIEVRREIRGEGTDQDEDRSTGQYGESSEKRGIRNGNHDEALSDSSASTATTLRAIDMLSSIVGALAAEADSRTQNEAVAVITDGKDTASSKDGVSGGGRVGGRRSSVAPVAPWVSPQLQRLAQMETQLADREEKEARRADWLATQLTSLDEVLLALAPILSPDAGLVTPAADRVGREARGTRRGSLGGKRTGAAAVRSPPQKSPTVVDTGHNGLAGQLPIATALPAAGKPTNAEAATVDVVASGATLALPQLSAGPTSTVDADEDNPQSTERVSTPSKRKGSKSSKNKAKEESSARGKKSNESARRLRSASASRRRRSAARKAAGSTPPLVQPAWDWRPPPRMDPTEALDLSLEFSEYRAGRRAWEMPEVLQIGADHEQTSAGEPKLNMWRTRWDEKWALQRGESQRNGLGGPGHVSTPTVRARVTAAPLAKTERSNAARAARPAIRAPPSSRWDLVRAHVGDIIRQ